MALAVPDLLPTILTHSLFMLTSKAMLEYKSIDRRIFPKCPCYERTVLFTVL